MPDSDNPERFAPGSVLHARPARTGVAGSHLREQVRLTVEGVRGDEGFPIVAFGEIGDRDAAVALRGYVLEVPSSELPELADDEFYAFDLEGLEVRDSRGAVIGRVGEVIESPAHPLLAISLAAGGEILVPFVLAAVPTVVLAEGYVVVEPRFTEEGDRNAGDSGETVLE